MKDKGKNLIRTFSGKPSKSLSGRNASCSKAVKAHIQLMRDELSECHIHIVNAVVKYTIVTDITLHGDYLL